VHALLGSDKLQHTRAISEDIEPPVCYLMSFATKRPCLAVRNDRMCFAFPKSERSIEAVKTEPNNNVNPENLSSFEKTRTFYEDSLFHIVSQPTRKFIKSATLESRSI